MNPMMRRPRLSGMKCLDGLHAKLFVIDHGWDASVFSGSFNATVHALQHNVEFMVELVGKKSRFGVDQFLRQVKGETNFADLLQDIRRECARLCRPTRRRSSSMICSMPRSERSRQPDPGWSSRPRVKQIHSI